MELGLLTLGDHRADPVTGVRTTQEEGTDSFWSTSTSPPRPASTP